MTKSYGQYYRFPIFLVILVLCMIIYTFLHEAGHAIFAFLAGADVRDIVVFSLRPHLSYADQVSGIFAPFVSLAGPMFPVIVAIILMLMTPKTNNVVLEAFKTIFTFLTAFSLLGTIISLFLYSFGLNSDADTIGFFSQNPGINPMLAAVACLFLIIILLGLIGKKANYLLIPSLFNLLQKNSSTITNRKKKVISSLLVLLSLGLAGACFFSPEKSYALIQTDLSTCANGEVELYRFDIKQDSLTFMYTIEGLNAKEFELFIRTDTSKTILFSGKEIIANIHNREFVLHKGLHLLLAQTINGNGIFSLNQMKN